MSLKAKPKIEFRFKMPAHFLKELLVTKRREANPEELNEVRLEGGQLEPRQEPPLRDTHPVL
jgi:hypothetical protein